MHCASLTELGPFDWLTVCPKSFELVAANCEPVLNFLVTHICI